MESSSLHPSDFAEAGRVETDARNLEGGDEEDNGEEEGIDDTGADHGDDDADADADHVQESWAVTSIPINVVVGKVDDTPRETKQVNLVDFVAENRGPMSKKGEKIYLADFNDNSEHYRSNVVMKAFNEWCNPQGFGLVAKGWEGRYGTLRIQCTRARLFRKQNRKAAVADESGDNPPIARRQALTRRPVDRQSTCRFRFSLMWDETRRLWYIHESNSGCMTHTGHGRMKPKVDFRVRATEADEGGGGATALVSYLRAYEKPTRTELSDIYRDVMRPKRQAEELSDIFSRIAAQCLTSEMFHYCRHLLNGVEAELTERNAARLNRTTSALARPTWGLIDADCAPVAKKGKSSHDRATM
jgi:hypothetical protein